MALKEDKNKIKTGLYVVSTPIGNLSDITLRALNVLNGSDVILCEDTRISKKLLHNYKIEKKTIPYHKFNEKKVLENIIDILKDGKIVSVISDAGTPTISDPGKILINRCIKENIVITPIPGPSAVTTALSISGFSDQFYFHGFLSDKENSIKKEFKMLDKLQCSIIFFISAQKLAKRLNLFNEFFNEREILICRELTKIHESLYRGKVSDIKNIKLISKGEFTIVISEKKEVAINDLNESDKVKIRNLFKNTSVKDIVRIFSQEKNISKSKIYNYCLQIKNEK